MTEEKKPKARTTQKAKETFKLAVVILIISGIVWLGIAYALNSDTPFSVVSGVSMEPTLHGGDVVVLDHVPFNQLKIGDIIVFRAPIYNTVLGGCNAQRYGIPCYIIHRIVNITKSSNGTELIKTKGDNNLISENGVDCLGNTFANCQPAVTQSDYIGKVVYRIPLVGVMAYAVSPPFNYAVLAFVIMLVIYIEYKSD